MAFRNSKVNTKSRSTHISRDQSRGSESKETNTTFIKSETSHANLYYKYLLKSDHTIKRIETLKRLSKDKSMIEDPIKR